MYVLLNIFQGGMDGTGRGILSLLWLMVPVESLIDRGFRSCEVQAPPLASARLTNLQEFSPTGHSLLSSFLMEQRWK